MERVARIELAWRALEGRLHGASERVSRLRSLPGRHRRRPGFALLNGPTCEALGGRIRDEDLARAEPILALVEDRAQARVTRAVQTIEPALAGAIAAGHLEIDPGAAVLRVVRTYFTSDDRPVQAQVMRCHPVHYRYTVTLFGGDDGERAPAEPGAPHALHVRPLS